MFDHIWGFGGCSIFEQDSLGTYSTAAEACEIGWTACTPLPPLSSVFICPDRIHTLFGDNLLEIRGSSPKVINFFLPTIQLCVVFRGGPVCEA